MFSQEVHVRCGQWRLSSTQVTHCGQGQEERVGKERIVGCQERGEFVEGEGVVE